jgi:hypothetical protein
MKDKTVHVTVEKGSHVVVHESGSSIKDDPMYPVVEAIEGAVNALGDFLFGSSNDDD